MNTDEAVSLMDGLGPIVTDLLDLSSEIKNEAIKISHGQPANKLFHYTSAEGLKGIIESSSIWATDYRFLNDDREVKDGLDIIKNVCLKSDNEIFVSLAKIIEEQRYELDSLVNPHISSFCVGHDLLSQWRAYGEQSEGYCIEFDFSDSHLSVMHNSTVIPCELIPVIYDDKTKIELTEFLLNMLSQVYSNHGVTSSNFSELSEQKKGIFLGLAFRAISILFVSFKDSGFAEEQEWRAVFMPLTNQMHEIRSFRIAGGSFTPYVNAKFSQHEDDCIVQREKLPLVSICLPPAAGSVSKEGLEMYLEMQGYGKQCLVKKSNIPLRNKNSIYW